MFKERIKALQAKLQNPILIKKKENLFYLTGRSFMHGYLLLSPRKHAERRNAETRGKPGVVFLGDGLERVEGIHSDFLKNVGIYVGKKETLEVFGEFTYGEVKYIKLKNPKLKVGVVVKHSPVDYQRIVKDDSEIALVKKSMQIVGKVFDQVRRKLMNPGTTKGTGRGTEKKRINTERELAEFIKTAGLKLGAEDISFPPIVAAGANAAIPHHVPSSKPLKSGESIIIDFGFKYKNYCSDFTRTVFLKKVPKKLEIAYNQVEKAYRESMLSAKVGAKAGAVYQRAVDVLAEKKLDKYFIHSLGHGTGLEIHELPNLSPGSKDELKDGMVFSIEPGVYIPKLGGIRIEDLVYLEKNKITKFINVFSDLKFNVF